MVLYRRLQSMTYEPEQWQRFVSSGVPIYLNPDKPSWFVPNTAGDRVLQRLEEKGTIRSEMDAARFLSRLPNESSTGYSGRASVLKTDHLREIWFHLTNRCNMACSHCLFSSSPDEALEMSTKRVLQLTDEAAQLGCRIFVLTGGEPFIHPGFDVIVDGILSLNEAHLVVLTNGRGLGNRLRALSWDSNRFHLQISVDGIGSNHDRIRGTGRFEALSAELKWLQTQGLPFTISMCVNKRNMTDMPNVVDFAAQIGAGNVHFMWYFIRGRGQEGEFALPEHIFPLLVEAAERAESSGIHIDNIDALRTQMFAPDGTIHDGTTTGWESIAVGPDDRLYPSAALVGVDDLATPLERGLAAAWRESPILTRLRETTAAHLSSPFRFLLGGGDTDHSYTSGGTFSGDDPYMPLHEKTALWLIAGEAARQPDDKRPRLRLKMGDILESCGAHGSVALVHSNCLLALAQKDSLAVVKEFYSNTSVVRTDILNPVSYPEDFVAHIPQEFRFRGYGCGSPVLDAEIQYGDSVLDLGSGGGVECLISSAIVGPEGRVVGVDMLDPMLERAQRAGEAVAQRIGYRNFEFKKGYLESLPFVDGLFDVAMSNCVMNLSVNKRRSFAEVYRVLKQGGRLVVSDVVCETEPDPAIRNDEVLRGECIAGAQTQIDLLALLEETGFENIRILKRFPYRLVKEHQFYSLTYSAHKPRESAPVRVLYRGPLPSVMMNSGPLLIPGKIAEISQDQADQLGDLVFTLDDKGLVADESSSCACCVISPEESAQKDSIEPPSSIGEESPETRCPADCMVCGARLVYLSEEHEMECAYCRQRILGNAKCDNGHFVCDRCHADDATDVIEHLCVETSETDMLALLGEIRKHPAIAVNGPEHHALVPGIILATYRNLGGDITPERITSGIRRGSRIPGGACGFLGVCGAGTGVGVAMGIILESNPLKADERQITMSITQKILAEIGALRAARCCQRDSWIALKKLAELSSSVLPVTLLAKSHWTCAQQHLNKQCFGKGCPLMP